MSGGAVLVIGAAGDVGQGIARVLLSAGRRVIGVGRNREKLEHLSRGLNSARFHFLAGDISSEISAGQLWERAVASAGPVSAVIISVNTPNRQQALNDWTGEDLTDALAGNVISHFIAAKVFHPLLPDDGHLLGIGGGTADFIIPGMTCVSMGQAALRMMYKGLARERKAGAPVQELMIVSMVAGASNRDQAPEAWLTDEEVGRHVCAILDSPGKFPAPVLHLRSREQVGLPEE